MEAGEYGLSRGTCFVARRLDVVAVAELLWISWIGRWTKLVHCCLKLLLLCGLLKCLF